MKAMTATLMLTALIAIAAFLSSPVQAAQDTLPPASWQAEGPKQHAEDVLAGLVRGDNERAFKLFFSRGRYPQQTLEKLQFDYYQTVKQQGNPMGYEKVYEQRAGTTTVRLKYILLFKTLPMMFDLYYYNAGKDWSLKSFTVSRDIKKIFER